VILIVIHHIGIVLVIIIMKMINDTDKPTHCSYSKIKNKITKYNVIDLILVSDNLKNKIYNYDTTSQMVYNNLNSIENNNNNLVDNNKNIPQFESDIKWNDDISDHFGISFELNVIRKNIKTYRTWRLNSKNWDKY
jgi:hypothetical protein